MPSWHVDYKKRARGKPRRHKEGRALRTKTVFNDTLSEKQATTFD